MGRSSRMLESYVTPILMSYVNRYIKNLKPSDLQLSLWGGDVVLSKLELKLDVLEQGMLFISARQNSLSKQCGAQLVKFEAARLKRAYPAMKKALWESTLTCYSVPRKVIVFPLYKPQKLRKIVLCYWQYSGPSNCYKSMNFKLFLMPDCEMEDHESCGSSSTNRSTTESMKSAVKSRRVQQAASPDPDLPPGYVQSLIRRVVNNVNIVINNLILKYVEDDIVLSVNITSAECYTVDEFWDRAFMDISATDLVLRKMINFSDCTVCLDKRNASGKIEFYQEPLLYKCSFRTRLHFTYDNLNSKMPSVIKIHTLVESLKLSISDQQLPMFIRIMQLGIALYYGEIGNFKDGEGEDLICHTKDMLGNITGTEDEASSVMQYPTQYISQDPYLHQDDDQQQGWVSWAWSFVPAIVSYDDEENDSGGIDAGTAEQQKSQSLKDPIVSVGFYCTKATVTFKLTEMQAESSYYSPQKVKSKEVICWEQEGTTVEETYTEIAGMQRFGAFYMDYLYTMESTSGKGYFLKPWLLFSPSKNNKPREAEVSEEFGNVQEMSTKSLIVGPLNLRLDSSAVHRIMKMIVCALEHEYEPYSRTKPDIMDGSRTMPSSEEVASLEEYIPTRLTTFTVLKCTVIIPVAEFNLLDHLLPIIMGEKNLSGLLSAASFQPLRPLPCIRILVDKVNLEHSVPMYAEQLVHVVSSLGQPSDNLLHYCYSHCYLKLRSVKSKNPLPTLEGSIQNVELKYCGTSLVKCASGTVGSIKICAKAPGDGGKEKLIPLIQGPSDTRDLHSSKWLNESRKPESLLAPDLVAFTIQIPQYMDYCHNSVNWDDLCFVYWKNHYLKIMMEGEPVFYTMAANEAPSSEIMPSFLVLGERRGSAAKWRKDQQAVSVTAYAAVHFQDEMQDALQEGGGGSEANPKRRPQLSSACPHPLGRKVLLLQLSSSKEICQETHPQDESARHRCLPFVILLCLTAASLSSIPSGESAVLLSSVQGLAINVDPVLYTWLIYQPQKRVSRHIQQSVGAVPLGVSVTRKKEDEASVGSAPLPRQQSNQASEYASSPVKTKTVTESRPLSLPVKTMLNSSENCRSPEERMKEFIGIVWNAVKCLTLQLEVQSCCVFLPNDSLPSPSTIVSGDIPGTVRNWYHGQASMPGTLVVCLPQIKIMSAGHKHMEPLQEIPFVVLRPILEEGDAFPWTISLHHFSIYTLLGQQMTLNLVEPMGCTSTLAVTSQKLLASGPESRHSFVVCLHVDLESLEIKCSNPQVQLLYELAEITSKVWKKIQRRGVLYQSVSSVYTETMTGPAPPSSPVKSSIGTIPPDTSTYSPSADIGTTTEGDSLQGDDSPFSDSITLEQTTSNIGVSSGRVSLWMQWMLPKITVKLFAPDPRNNGTEVCIVSELEDLSASVDMQDVYTKIKCKIESFNIDHYRNSLGEDSWSLGQYGGVFLSCTDKLNRRTLLVRPISKQDPFSNFSGFFPSTTAKLLDGSHQQHGFLSLTYTKAVTKNVRHKLISRNERRTFHKLSEGHTDGSPHFLHEILLSAQAFDVVLSFPLLNAIASIFQARLPRSQKEKRKSPGQPMRTHTLTSRNLPLIYINTGVIRVFFPKNEEDHHIAEANPSIKEDTLVLKIGSVSMAPQADNPLSRAVLRKDIYQRALNLGILRDPGSEVEDRQYQIDLQSINIGTAYWNQLKPEKENGKGGVLTETERNSQNPALEWNMASSIRRHQERRAILTPILTDFTVRITAAPAIIFTKIDAAENLHPEEILVCGHSLEVNMTTNLDFFLNVAQVQLLQQLVQANMVGLEPSSSTTEVSKQEQKKMDVADGGTVETSSRCSGAQDSGIGSDSVKIRIIQIEQHSGTSQHRIARPSRQSSIVKNLNFIPFDIFVTASRISLMTYSCTASPKSKSVQDQKDGEKISKSSLNLPETVSGSSQDTKKPSQPCISSVTADDLLNSNPPLSAGRRAGLLSLESLHASTRSSARQALGITIVRQPGRRGTGDIELQPFLYLVVSQPSVLLSCHHRKQKVEISVFDAGLKGVASDYKCTDPGKTLPEALDYCKIWLQTVAGEVDAKSGIPPPLITVQIKDFLNGPADVNVDISKPLKANLSFARLDQINQFLKKIITTNEDVPRKEAASSAGIISDEDVTLISRHPNKKDFLPAVHTNTVQKASMQENLWQALSCFQKISIHTVQLVVLMETIPHPSKPCLLVSFSNLSGSLNIKSGHKSAGIHGSSLVLDIKDFLLKTSLKERAKSLIGPFCCSVNVEAKWCKHSGDPGPEQSVPKIYIDLRGGLLQVFWGQEHLNCLVLLQELLWQYLTKKGSVETLIPERTYPTCFSTERNQASKTEHTSDDLRTGLFQYIQDAEAQKLPSAYEVVFYNETEDSPGMMLWRYPEPRVLTLVRINPVPFNTTEDPDISTADLGDVLQVPCSLEYWDELQKSFVAFREFSLSESKVCELQLPSISLVSDQKELIASDLWRIVLNSSQNVADDQSSETPPKFLQPFLSDKSMPSELEYMIISFDEPHVYLRQWNDESVFQEIQFSTQADCKLLECRNVTMQSVVKPFKIWGQIAVSSSTAGRLFDCTIMVDPIFISFGQYALHSLNTAIQAWQQNQCPEAEEFVFSHFVICNDTQETLRFGQVDTDENILLATLHTVTHLYRRLGELAVVGAIQCGQYRDLYSHHSVQGPDSIAYHQGSAAQWSAEATKQKLPSYILENNELTELSVKSTGDEDWSQDVCLSSKHTEHSTVIQIATKSHPGGNVSQVLSEFYGIAGPPQPAWPYNRKDSDSNEQLSQWDSPMRVKLSVWKPCVKTLLIELLPWALLINQSKWDLWLFEGEKILLQVPSGKDFHSADGAVFSVGPAGAGSGEALSAVPCWDLLSEPAPSAAGTSLGDRRVVLSFSAGSRELWSLPAIVSAELARQSVAVPTGTCAENCKTRDLLPSILLKVVSSDEIVNEWSDFVDINNQGTQIVFLTGFGCIYVDITHHCGTIVITLAPEGRAGSVGINLKRSQEQTVSLKMFISQLSLAAFDDITNHKVSSELLRLTADNVFLHMAPATSSLSQEFQQDSVEGLPQFHSLQVYCEDLQLDNQLYSKSNFHFAVLLCQEEKNETAQWSRMNNLIVCNKDLETYKENCFIKLCIAFSEEENFMFHVNDLSFELKPARLYVEDTFVYYIKTLFDTYLPENKTTCKFVNASDTTLIVPEQVREHARALVKPVKLRKLKIQPVNLLVSIHASLKLYIASDHTPLSFSVFERGPIFTTARQLVHALAMHYAAGALFRAGWVVGSLEILGSPASLVQLLGLWISRCRIFSEYLRPKLLLDIKPEGSSQVWGRESWASSQSPLEGQLSLSPRQVMVFCMELDFHSFPSSALIQTISMKMLQSLGRPEVHMALDVMIVSGSGQQHEGCLLLTSEVLFVVSISEDTQQQAFPVTEIDCLEDDQQKDLLKVQLKQQRVPSDLEAEGARERLSEQQYNRLVEYITKTSCHLAPSTATAPAPQTLATEQPLTITKTYHYVVDPNFAQVFISKFTMVKNKALRKGFN
ncbi:hypothetical protein IHE44_0001167 [Lamprotornis superbus]|uniref:Vacuolar protein sorting-associated protein 13B n=1 Tax=Lamprotornis superbus TaxID=245042 RepID=A0A835U2J2_9PASS|nr:hypothetical protein IHE44_0001167 [Lamprotornis superbus]